MAVVGRVLILALAIAPTFARAALCFRSAPAANIGGINGPATVTILWNDAGDAMDEIKIEGDRVSVANEMICTDSAPILCRLGEGVGAVRLVFEGRKIRLVSSGLEVKRAIEGGERVSRLALKTRRQTMVNELNQLSEDECRAAFPIRRAIHVFPETSPEKTETRPPQTSR